MREVGRVDGALARVVTKRQLSKVEDCKHAAHIRKTPHLLFHAFHAFSCFSSKKVLSLKSTDYL